MDLHRGGNSQQVSPSFCLTRHKWLTEDKTHQKPHLYSSYQPNYGPPGPLVLTLSTYSPVMQEITHDDALILNPVPAAAPARNESH